MIKVASRVHRILRGMEPFAYFSESVEIPDGLPSSAGIPIGVYFNDGSSFDGAIVVTDSAVVLNEKSGWVSVPYRSIARVVIPFSSAARLSEVRHLILNLLDGSSFILPVLGGT